MISTKDQSQKLKEERDELKKRLSISAEIYRENMGRIGASGGQNHGVLAMLPQHSENIVALNPAKSNGS